MAVWVHAANEMEFESETFGPEFAADFEQERLVFSWLKDAEAEEGEGS